VFVSKLTVFILICLLLVAPCRSFSDEIRVAVASNFRDTMSALAGQFEQASEHEVTLIFGSSGKQYAQIRNGAPFDAFFSADSRRPELLEHESLAVPGSRFTYAVGKLVLWSPQANYVDPGGNILEHGDFLHLAIANPGLAPYGEAAREALEAMGLWNQFGKRLVRGENIGQAFQFVNSGNAELGFIAWSQLKRNDAAIKGSYWLVPARYYSPIEQQAILLRDTVAARMFMSFILSDKSAKIIRAHGYDLP
jgi:molybdate transport system substrate-binding protein